MKTYLVDYTKEFLAKSKPGIGSVKLEDGLDINTHQNEIETAYWLLKMFGGEITVLKEKNMYKIKTPDYEWDGKFWELKNVNKKSSIKHSINMGTTQTKSNRGGLIIDIKNTKFDLNSIRGFIRDELSYIKKASGFIIIKNRKRLLSVYKIIKGASSR